MDKAYKTLEPEFAAGDVSVTDMRLVIDPKDLYEQAFKEAIEWQQLDEWMRRKLQAYFHHIQQEKLTKPKSVYHTYTDAMRGKIVDGYIREFNKLLVKYHYDMNVPEDVTSIISLFFKEGIYLIRLNSTALKFSLIKGIYGRNAIVSNTGHHKTIVVASRVYAVDSELVIDEDYDDIMRILNTSRGSFSIIDVYFMKVCVLSQ